jgi:hypothetical protein
MFLVLWAYVLASYNVAMEVNMRNANECVETLEKIVYFRMTVTKFYS